MANDVDRKTMERALRDGCVPRLRQLGFKGSFPDFYRESDGFISLVNFQFYSASGSFFVNLSYTDTNRNNVYFRPETETRKLRVKQTNDRYWLGAPGGEFCFGKTNYGVYRGTPIPPDELVSIINDLFVTDGERWWSTKSNAAMQKKSG